MASLALARNHRTSGSAGIAPRQRGPDPAGTPLAFERARPSRRRQHGSAQDAGSIHDRTVHRVETARMSLKRTPGSRLAPRGGQNGARPGYRAILHGEYALCALEGLFGFPCRSVRIGGHASAQGVHPSAVETLGVHNGQLPSRWSLLTTPSPKAHGPRSAGVRAEGPGRVRVGLLSGQGVSNLYQPPRKAISVFWRPRPDLL